MPEVRQEVLVAAAVLFSALVTYIGFQSLYPPDRKAPFAPKKPTVKKSKEDVSMEVKVAPNKNTCQDESFRGRILEK